MLIRDQVQIHIDRFCRAIELEMRAIKRSQGPFEAEVYDGRRVKIQEQGEHRYRFRLKFSNEKAVVGAECDLRCGSHEFMVKIVELDKKTIVVASDHKIPMNQQEYTLVFYPWFIYQSLLRTLNALGARENVESALKLFGDLPSKRETVELKGEHQGLNPSQKGAIQHSINNELSFIWGPPGTGKTTTLVHVVSELLSQGSRVLVTATTNAAVQQALSKLRDNVELSGYFDLGKVLRLGTRQEQSHGTMMHEVHQRLNREHLQKIQDLERRLKGHQAKAGHCRDLLQKNRANEQPLLSFDLTAEVEYEALQDHELTPVFSREYARDISQLAHSRQKKIIELRLKRHCRSEESLKVKLSELRRRSALDEAKLVSRARVVMTTLTHLYMNSLLESESFDAVIVDEASMAIQPMLFTCAAMSRKRVIVIGDPRQLPPIIQADDEEVYVDMGKNIFELQVPRPFEDSRVAMLDVQYRMAPEIAGLVSDFFYAGRLRTDPALSRDRISDLEPFSGHSMCVVNTRGQARCHVKEGSYSRFNEESARICVDLATQGLDAGMRDCAIITPYAAQSRLIRQLWQKTGHVNPAFECSTVHRFQGQERELVIIDLVDSDPYPAGTLLTTASEKSAANNLLNVSLSRAQGKLIVVADVEYFHRRAPRTTLVRVLDAIQSSHGVDATMIRGQQTRS